MRNTGEKHIRKIMVYNMIKYMGKIVFRTSSTQGGKYVKIAYIITRADAIGGAQVHVKDLAYFFKKQGHEVIVLVGGTGPFTEKLRELDIPYIVLRHLVRPINPFKELLALKEIINVLCQVKPDIISLHSSKAGWLGRLAAKWLKIPVVFTAHGWSFTEGVPNKKRLVYRWAEKLVAPFTDKIITVSEYDRELAIRYKIAYPSKIVTIHNGMSDIDSTLFAKPEVEPVHLIMVARFEEPKDHILLLEALRELKDLSWTLELIGDGPLMGRVKEKAENIKILDRVQFSGTRDDVPFRLSRAQIFVLASKWEGFPLSILEAMRAGLPVIASDVGGVKEAVINGVTGYLVSRGDKYSLKNYLKQLILDPDKRVQFGLAGRKRYKEFFTFERMAKQTMEVYREVVGQKI